MSSARDARLANLFAVLCTSVADDIHAAAGSTAQMSGAAAAALVALHESEAGQSLDRLRRTVGLTPSGGVRLVDRLVELGYVRRREGSDARSIALSLTSSGSRAANRILRARADAVTRVLHGLSREEQTLLVGLSEKLVGAMAADRMRRRVEGDIPPGGAMCRLCDFTACQRAQGRCPAAGAAAAE